jgi:hypothetical protein
MISETASEQEQHLCLHRSLLGITGLGVWNMRMLNEALPHPYSEERVTLSETGSQLLRILYDRRLAPRMTVDETLPLLRGIVEDLR